MTTDWELKRFVLLASIVVFEIFEMLQKDQKLTLVLKHKLS